MFERCHLGAVASRRRCRGGSAPFEAADHGADSGPADERFGDGRVACIAARCRRTASSAELRTGEQDQPYSTLHSNEYTDTGPPSMRGQPGQAAFRNPPLQVCGEATLLNRPTADLHSGVQRRPSRPTGRRTQAGSGCPDFTQREGPVDGPGVTRPCARARHNALSRIAGYRYSNCSTGSA